MIIGFVSFSNSPAQRLKKQLDLGQKYLNTLNYEQAVGAFTKALNLDPVNTEAKEKLVVAYCDWGKQLALSKDYDLAV